MQEEDEQLTKKRKMLQEEDDLMHQYMRFLMIAQMQNSTAAQEVSFEQYKKAKEDIIQQETSEKHENPETKKEKKTRQVLSFASRIAECVSDKISDAAHDAIDAAKDAVEGTKAKSSNEIKSEEELTEDIIEKNEEEVVESFEAEEISTDEPEEAEYLEETELVDISDEPEHTIPTVKVVEPITEKEPEKNITDVNELLKMKFEAEAEALSEEPEDDELDDFQKIMLQLQRNKLEKAETEELSNRKTAIVKENLDILDKNLKANLRSDTELEKKNVSGVLMDENELESRKQAALKQQEKERKKAERQAERALRRQKK